jgi:hypothetical protein
VRSLYHKSLYKFKRNSGRAGDFQHRGRGGRGGFLEDRAPLAVRQTTTVEAGKRRLVAMAACRSSAGLAFDVDALQGFVRQG